MCSDDVKTTVVGRAGEVLREHCASPLWVVQPCKRDAEAISLEEELLDTVHTDPQRFGFARCGSQLERFVDDDGVEEWVEADPPDIAAEVELQTSDGCVVFSSEADVRHVFFVR